MIKNLLTHAAEALLLLGLILWTAFEVIVLRRHVTDALGEDE